ncbi:MAG: APC family permease [Cellulosilyticaceae bacterium]
MKEKKYGLFTAIAMIVGIVIGSGIFFKSDDILVATGGSISLGVLVFCLAAVSIIFGSLTIACIASRTDEAGGIITYAEYTCNKYIACAFGWFHTFLYYPTLIAVVSWVTGVYIALLFNLQGGLIVEVLIGFAVMSALFGCNILSVKLGGYFQNASTIIKLIPLFIIAILGIFLGDPGHIEMSNITKMQSATWITAIAPIAFAFDGWIISTSIGHELKDSKRNLPLALIVAPLFILAIYILYFVGISIYIGPENVMALGNDHVYVAANQLFGTFGGKLILVFVIISVMGTVNGLIMGLIRLPYSLAIRNMFPKSSRFNTLSSKYGISIYSAGVTFVLTTFWLVLHFVTQYFSFLPNSDISEISITINYFLYIVLYIKVFQLGRKGEIPGLWRGKINPIFASIGSLTILLGSMWNPLFWVYAALCAMLLAGAMYFWHIQQKKL